LGNKTALKYQTGLLKTWVITLSAIKKSTLEP